MQCCNVHARVLVLAARQCRRRPIAGDGSGHEATERSRQDVQCVAFLEVHILTAHHCNVCPQHGAIPQMKPRLDCMNRTTGTVGIVFDEHTLVHVQACAVGKNGPAVNCNVERELAAQNLNCRKAACMHSATLGKRCIAIPLEAAADNAHRCRSSTHMNCRHGMV